MAKNRYKNRVILSGHAFILPSGVVTLIGFTEQRLSGMARMKAKKK
jgi:hypothetical protein